MPYIDDTWASTAYAALRQSLDVDDHTRRDMIQFLMDEGFWDASMAWPSAQAKWNSCLNPAKPEFFKVGELWALARRFGRHQLFLAMAEDLGYEVRQRPTEERRQLLLERMADTQEQLLALLQGSASEMQRIGTAVPAAHTPRPGTGRFALDGDAAGLEDAAPARTAIQRVGCP